MKKFVCLILFCALLIPVLSGCAGQTGALNPEAESADAAASGLAQALESESAQDETKAVTLEDILAEVDEEPEAEAVVSNEYGDAVVDEAETPDQEVAVDVPLTTAAPAPEPASTAEPAKDTNSGTDAQVVIEAPANHEEIVQPFATSTPQPNAFVAAYSECSGTGLGFKFRYPTGWENIPGRSTICYVQPLDNGTVYPARVAVTMKKLNHRCTDELCKNELVDYLKTLRTQFDNSTFEVDPNLDLSHKFMSKAAMATSYLAYDGDQEVAGYVIMTYFERYVFVYHFSCAYEDYAAFQTAIATMRDSVAADG